MCRMLGVVCNDADLLGCALQEVRESLRIKSPTHHDGIGIGYYVNEQPLLKKRPSTKASGVDCVEIVEGVRSQVLLVHVRKATVGVWKDANTHPFRYRMWLFAHVGHLAALEQNREELVRRLPNFLQRNMQGETDSELAFHLFLDILFSQGRLDDLDIPATEVGEHLKTCWDQINRLDRAADQPVKSAILVTNGQIMAAICQGVPMHYSHREGILECPVHEQSEQQLQLHRRFRGIMLGAEMLNPGHHWRELSDSSLLSVSKALELKVQQI